MTSRVLPRLAAPTVVLVLVIVAVLPLFTANAAGISATLTITGLSSGSDTTTLDASSVGYAIENTTSASAGAGGSTGASTFGVLEVRHELKAAQTQILSAAANGRHLPTVTLALKMDGSTLAKFTLTDATIAKASMTGRGGSPETSFAYRTITVTVQGSTFCWDISTNAAC